MKSQIEKKSQTAADNETREMTEVKKALAEEAETWSNVHERG